MKWVFPVPQGAFKIVIGDLKRNFSGLNPISLFSLEIFIQSSDSLIHS
jgi:hypothetical protein